MTGLCISEKPWYVSLLLGEFAAPSDLSGMLIYTCRQKRV